MDLPSCAICFLYQDSLEQGDIHFFHQLATEFLPLDSYQIHTLLPIPSWIICLPLLILYAYAFLRAHINIYMGLVEYKLSSLSLLGKGAYWADLKNMYSVWILHKVWIHPASNSFVKILFFPVQRSQNPETEPVWLLDIEHWRIKNYL